VGNARNRAERDEVNYQGSEQLDYSVYVYVSIERATGSIAACGGTLFFVSFYDGTWVDLPGASL